MQLMQHCLKPTLILQARGPSHAMHATQIRLYRRLCEHHGQHHKQAWTELSSSFLHPWMRGLQCTESALQGKACCTVRKPTGRSAA